MHGYENIKRVRPGSFFDNNILEFAMSKCRGERDGRISEMDISDIFEYVQKCYTDHDHCVLMHTMIVIYNTLNLTDPAKDFFLRSLTVHDIRPEKNAVVHVHDL